MLSCIPVGDKQDGCPYPLVKYLYLQMYNSKGITTNILLIGIMFLLPKQIRASSFSAEAIRRKGTCV